METLPHEVKELIFHRIEDSRDMLHLALTCTEFLSIFNDPLFWRTQIVYRFGTTHVPPEDASIQSLKEAFAKLGRLVLGGPDMYGAHVNNASHFNHVEIPQQKKMDQNCLKLEYVWWFEVEGHLHSVPAGTYRPFFRILIPQTDNTTLNDIALVASSPSDLLINSSTTIASFAELYHAARQGEAPSDNTDVYLPGSRWMTLYLRPIVITEYSDIKLGLRDYNHQTLKRELIMDALGLQRVIDQAEMNGTEVFRGIDGKWLRLEQEVEIQSAYVSSRVRRR
ncbi:hypothetical protein HDU99_003078 [Rhizoclosmatium hyalinum]|nr:hypothetical protein HDU99_003078 [Rhizoclosmatium hyalinum]